MNRALAFALPLALLAGCATAPRPLRGEFAPMQPGQASATDASGQAVRWGGSIVETTPSADQTCFEILGRELGDSARPRLQRDLSAGRFIACRTGFYDPAIFAPEREVTITGRIVGYETRRIGEYDYRYPRVAAEVIYLWPQREDYLFRPAPDPFMSINRPYWWHGYYGPYHLVPRRTQATPPPPPRKPEK